MRLLNSIKAFPLLLSNTGIFHPAEIFQGKRVAIIGAANTAFEEENGDYIDSFDLVVRINKAVHVWKPEHRPFIGKKTNILFHSFFENEYSGGGPINPDLFSQFGVEYLVHPNRDFSGLIAHLNFYKRHLKAQETYLLDGKIYRLIREKLDKWVPTVGFSALCSVLNGSCKEVFITGFTFFQTPYSSGYRDQFLDPGANKKHIEDQGLHKPDLEFNAFLELYEDNNCEKIICDKALTAILQSEGL